MDKYVNKCKWVLPLQNNNSILCYLKYMYNLNAQNNKNKSDHAVNAMKNF